jgi:kynurenine 3-monooxygenase
MITVAGAGLVGSLLSIYLARRGFDVEILERRPDMRINEMSAGRSINLAISVRGIHALQKIGLADTVLTQAVPMRGRMMHSPRGELTFQAYGQGDRECIHSISRGFLNQVLMTEAEKSGRVKIRFEREVAAPLATDGVLFGTDGAGSAVRKALVARGITRESASPLDYGYKELTLPAAPGAKHRFEAHALHIWPRGTFMLIALPNFDGSFTCTLFLPHRSTERTPGFDRLTEPAQARALFATQFKDALEFLPDLEDQFFGHPTGHMVTVKCAPWNDGGRTLLLGDAAHAIVPFFGQGMNCGFEDVTELDALLEKHGSDWTAVFAAFARTRKPQADAIADMAVDNFVEMRDKVGQPAFLLQKEVEKRLQARYPRDYRSRYSLVTFSRQPYRVALEAGLIGDEILSELCRGILRAEDADLALADRLIAAKMKPYLQKHLGDDNGS